MRYKTLFRVLLKVVGVWLVVTGLANLGDQIIGPDFSPRPNAWSFVLPRSFGWLVSIAIGLYLFFGGRWVVDLAIPTNRPYCSNCGYDLSEHTSGQCPECGGKVQSGGGT